MSYSRKISHKHVRGPIFKLDGWKVHLHVIVTSHQMHTSHSLQHKGFKIACNIDTWMNLKDLKSIPHQFNGSYFKWINHKPISGQIFVSETLNWSKNWNELISNLQWLDFNHSSLDVVNQIHYSWNYSNLCRAKHHSLIIINLKFLKFDLKFLQVWSHKCNNFFLQGCSYKN